MYGKKLNLICEYDLNEGTYLILKLLEESGEIRWDTASDYMRLKEISGQPAHLLRSLIQRGLVSGPVLGEKIQAKPFALTDQGKEILGKIERGLHRPEWLSEHKVRALAELDGPNSVAWSVLKDKVRKVTLLSLDQAGYVVWRDPIAEITALGREALAEWRQQRLEIEEKVCG